jgi:hypothetical protein
MSDKLQLPKSNVKRVMKLNDDVKVVSAVSRMCECVCYLLMAIS